jgi:hypothetical protein
VGDMGKGMMGRRLFDLISEGGVKWNSLPDPYDVFVYPNLQLRAYKGEANFRTALTAAFPNERSNHRAVFPRPEVRRLPSRTVRFLGSDACRELPPMRAPFPKATLTWLTN